MEDLAWRYILWFYDQSDLIFSPSESTRDELAGRGIARDKICLMPRGVDTDRFRPDLRRDEPGLPAGTRLLYVGRVSKEKDLPLLGRAFKRLAAKHPRVSLIVVGDGPYLGEMKRLMDGSPCHFTGYLEGEDLAAAYASCDLFVFPSTTDTFGNVALEAQASGLPVVVSDAGGPAENMLPDETGLIVHGHDEDALLAAMRALIEAPAILKRMGIRARAYAETRSYAAAFDQYWDLYRGTPEDEISDGAPLQKGIQAESRDAALDRIFVPSLFTESSRRENTTSH
jgi:glycosyltransferase involved in cell wall biosynthesis